MYTLRTDTHFEQILDVLSYSPLFFDFSLDELAEVIRAVELVVFEDGEALTIEGEPTQGFYVLVDGRVLVSVGQAQGGRLEVVTLGPPESIGDVSLIVNMASSADTQATGSVL